MKNQQTEELKPSSHESQGDKLNKQEPETPVANSGSISNSSNNNRKVSREDIELVQNLIERCLQLYMNRREVARTLLNRARIEPGFTNLVWLKLEEENSEFFRAYYIRLKLKKQIILFNHFLEHQYHLMKYPVPPKVPMTPVHNGIHPMPVNNLPMGYPVLQQSPIPAPGQPHFDGMNWGLSNCHVVNGVPAPGNYHHPIQINTGNNNLTDASGSEVAPPAQCSAMSSVSEMTVSPASASSDHFPIAPSEISGIDMDTSVLDTAFTSGVENLGGLELGMNGARSLKDSLTSMGQISWNFSLSDLTADLTNLEDIGALRNYPGSSCLRSYSDILFDSPENDDIVEEYFVDNIAGPGSDEEKS